MSGHIQHRRGLPLQDALDGQPSNTLVVGDMTRWKAQGRVMPPLAGFQFVDIDELGNDVVKDIAPDIILSPLVGDDFDAVDVALKLIAMNFQGRYRAISDDLPNSELVRKEVRQLAPELDFDLLLMPRVAAE